MKKRLFDVSKTPLVFRCKEDEIFFHDQKGDRKFKIGSLDVTDSRKINSNKERRDRDKRKLEKPNEKHTKKL